MEKTSIYLRDDQLQRIREDEAFNLSGFVRQKLDEAFGTSA